MMRVSCILAAAFLGVAQGQQLPAEVWRAGADALAREPGLVRFYSFKDAAAVQSNRAEAAAAMTFKPDGRSVLTTEQGRVAGLAAAVLDGESFEAPALTFPSNAFTVAVWLRPLAAGGKAVGSGTSGMIASSGSGYYDGWRLLLPDWKTRRPALELGKEKGAFSVRASDALSAGFWNHVAATWDGARARVYVNGMLSSEKPYAGQAAAPKGSLRLGFSGYGVGSLKMAVDELAVFDRALPPEQVAELSLVGQPLPAALRPLVRQAQEAAGAGHAGGAGAAYRAVAAAAGVPAAWKLWAELAVARLPDATRGARAGTEACAALFENPAAPAHLRGQAMETLVQVCYSGRGSELPSRVLAKLPELIELDADSQRLFGLALAEAYMREKNDKAADGVFKQILAVTLDEPRDRAEIRQRYAQALWQLGRWGDAREQYALLMADARLPAQVRGLAALSVAQVWRQEGKLAEAADAYGAVTGVVDRASHLRDEAAACAAECANQLAGRPARDPESTRQRALPLPEPSVRYFVSPKGRDANPGTYGKPFATLERARDAVRGHKRQGALPQGGACVYLRGGRYAVTNTFTLSEADSGGIGAPVVYRAWQDERPVFDGGFHVRGFRKVRDAAVLGRLPPEARGKVYVADVKAQGFAALGAQPGYGRGQTNQAVRELFQDGQPLEPARWPNAGNLRMEKANITNLVFSCPTNRIARWARADDLMANGYWLHLWAECTVPVASADAATGVFTLKAKPYHDMRDGRPFYVLNLLEEIDRPGEWFLDRAGGLLYVWPLKHPRFSEWVLSRWDKPFVEAKSIQDVVFQGLTFEYGQQHGLVLGTCANVTVAGNVIRRLGGTALTVGDGANVKIYGNVLHTLGHAGMLVGGGNRKNLTSGRIVIENNDVGHFARCSRTYNPALLLEGCGARVAHNRFHHAPSSAMRIEGNDHLIEYNRVDHVVRESDDQGGIDMWCNPSYRGVTIRFNHWQDIGGGEAPCGQAGIRFDDAISGMVVYGNLFERTSAGHFGGVQIHGGHNNIIDNNVFTGCRYGVSFSAWGPKRWEDFLESAHVKRLLYADVNIRLPPYSTRYPELADLRSRPDSNRIWRNLFIGAEEAFYKKPKGTEEWENRVFAETPDLKAVEDHTPFRPLPPLEEIGLYDDPLRVRAGLNDL